jgi:transposase
VKLASVLADPFGVSGQLMLEALLEGKASADEIAELAKGRARRRIPKLAASLAGHRMREHHRRMIRYSLEHGLSRAALACVRRGDLAPDRQSRLPSRTRSD